MKSRLASENSLRPRSHFEGKTGIGAVGLKLHVEAIFAAGTMVQQGDAPDR